MQEDQHSWHAQCTTSVKARSAKGLPQLTLLLKVVHWVCQLCLSFGMQPELLINAACVILNATVLLQIIMVQEHAMGMHVNGGL